MTKTVFEIIDEFPKQLLEGIRAGSAIKSRYAPATKPYTIVICGMGGSALPGLVLRDIIRAEKLTGLHLLVHRNYGLPPEISDPSAVVIISYSGNTEEACSSYQEARRRRLPLFVIASGGKLITWARRDHVPCVELASGYPPRFALPQMLGALLALASGSRFLSPGILSEAKTAARRLRPAQLRKNARVLARHLAGRIPLVYARDELAALAYIWKIQANENAKIPAFANTFPELNHNELNIFTRLSPRQTRLHEIFAGLLLRDNLEAPRLKKRFDITKKMMRRSGTPAIEVVLKGQTPIERNFYGIMLGAMTSAMLSEYYGIDPLPVALIEEFKRELNK